MAVAELHGRVMASRLHLIAVGESGSRSTTDLHAALRDAASHLEHLERCWSRFLPTSDVSRINQLGPAGGTIDVDPSTLSLLATMLEGLEVTTGRFDPTVLPALMEQGYGASHVEPHLVCPVGPAGARAGSLHEIELDPSANTVKVPGGLLIDPGGIGKGLAADLAVGRLIEAGVAGALVCVGGDLAMAGTPVDPTGWLVEVEHPAPARAPLCSLAISGGGVATSSVRSRRWVHDGVERHHQIDPRTHECSATDLVAVTVIAPTGWLAEVHATAALAAGSGSAVGYLVDHGLDGIAVGDSTRSGDVWTTPALAGIELRPRSDAR